MLNIRNILQILQIQNAFGGWLFAVSDWQLAPDEASDVSEMASVSVAQATA